MSTDFTHYGRIIHLAIWIDTQVTHHVVAMEKVAE